MWLLTDQSTLHDINVHMPHIELNHTLREESSQTNVILHYKLLASILSVMCSLIQQS